MPGIELFPTYGRRRRFSTIHIDRLFSQRLSTGYRESHVTIPQIGAMYNGTGKKENLVNYGFRLPSAFDNRPLKFIEFEQKVNNAIYVSATPAKYEREKSTIFVEQIIRPTGLIDPEIQVKPVEGQIDDLINEIKINVDKKQRVLVTTLTKKMAEDLTDYLKEVNYKVKYLHSDVDTLERMQIIRDLRLGVFDVLVGINLLREGLDLPEVSLVAILDADKEGFLRSETSLIQTIGRAARNVEGRVIMYADRITNSMKVAIGETNRRRKLQTDYNIKNNIEPQSIMKSVHRLIEATESMDVAEEGTEYVVNRKTKDNIAKNDVSSIIEQLKKEMTEAAKNLQFERAAEIRDKIMELEKNE